MTVPGIPGLADGGTLPRPLILQACDLKPGDYVHEYAATVVQVQDSPHYDFVLEVTLNSQESPFFMSMFGPYMHVRRDEGAGPDDDEDDDGQQHDVRPEDWEW